MKICTACRGDGLKHPNHVVFEIVEDEPCRDCKGTGMVKGIARMMRDISHGASVHETTIEIECGEQECEYSVRVYYTTYPATFGARVDGMQMEPDEPASFEIEEVLIEVGKDWYVLNASDVTLHTFESEIRNTDEY